MAVYAGPETADDGLIFSADVANSRSYTTGTTIINSVSGVPGGITLTGSLLNGSVYNSVNGGNVYMDGVDDVYRLPKSLAWCPAGINGQKQMTFNFWFKYFSGSFIIIRPFNSFDGYYQFRFDTDGFVRISGGNAALDTYGYMWGGSFSTNVWHNLCFSIDLTNLKLYRNGELKRTAAHGITTPYTGVEYSFDQFIGMGGFPYIYVAGTGIDGYIGICNVYNRVLTDTEVYQNFTGLRARYNI